MLRPDGIRVILGQALAHFNIELPKLFDMDPPLIGNQASDIRVTVAIHVEMNFIIIT